MGIIVGVASKPSAVWAARFQSTMDEGKQGLEEPIYTQNCVLDETLKRNENCQWAMWPLTITTLSKNKAKQKPVKGKSNDET